jgi:PAS domain S-box-containing protein
MTETEINREYYLFLQKSFEEFNESTVRLQNAFNSLERKFEDINRELELKNIELEKTIAEKDEMQNYLRNILQSLTTGVIVTGLDGRIETLNSCAEQMLGVRQAGATGRPLGEMAREFAGFAALPQMGAAETKLRTNGRILEILTSPMLAVNGSATGRVFILRDITRMEKLEEMAQRTEKFDAMGELAAKIAHEIRNPLGSIELFASLLLKKSSGEDREKLSHVITAVRSMDNRISNLLMFTRKQKPFIRELRLDSILEDVITFVDGIIRQNGIELETDFDPAHVLYVSGDGEMLKQVFLNIILNSLQAMPGGGSLKISSRVAEAPGPASAQGQAPGQAEVGFWDSGEGISPGNMKKIFDPFFSTREEGAGLGLAIVHNIIDSHRGAIDVESREGSTFFRISLPLMRVEAAGRAGSGKQKGGGRA